MVPAQFDRSFCVRLGLAAKRTDAADFFLNVFLPMFDARFSGKTPHPLDYFAFWQAAAHGGQGDAEFHGESIRSAGQEGDTVATAPCLDTAMGANP